MNLFKTTASISFFTLISRFTGLIREILIASYFGVSEQTDAFFVAFRIPNLLRRLFAEGAFSQAFVPVLGEIKSKEGDQKAKSLAIKVGVVLSIILVIVTLLCIILSPFIVWLMTGGFNNNQKYELTVQLTQWMFPYIFFISLVALSSGVLNTFSKFRIPAVTPVLLNLSFIFCTLFLTPYLKLPIWSLAVAVLLGGIAQLIVQFWALKKIGLFQNIQFSWFNPYKKITEIAKDQNIQKILTLMLPASMAVSVAQLSLIINTNIASRLEPGSVSWLSYADRIMELPTALLGVALGTVLLPTLTKSWNENDNKNISKLLDWGLKLVAFFCIPCSMIMAIMSEPIGAVIFHYGEFSNKDLMMSSQAISAYSIGIFGLVAIKILAPGYYSQQDIKTPVKIALITLLITQILNVFLVPIFAHVGLALAIGIAAFFNALMLLIILIHRKVYRPKMDWIRFLVAIFISSLAISIFCYSTSKTINWIELQSQPFVRLFYFLIIIITSSLLYLALIKGFGYSLKKLFLPRLKGAKQ